jgi:2-oxoglutarate ferredoxin oxidoreductase subunit delta
VAASTMGNGSGPGAVAFVRVEIAADRCKGCELCVGACPKHVLELDLSEVNVLGHHPVHVLDQASCTSCVLCARICPDSVFTVYAPPRGTPQ